MSSAQRVRLVLNPTEGDEEIVVDKLTSLLSEEILATLHTMINRERSRPIEINVIRDPDPEDEECEGYEFDDDDDGDDDD